MCIRDSQWNVPGEFMLQNHGMTVIRSPLQAQIVRWQVQKGDSVKAGDLLVILEAMKMEHEIRAEHAGRVSELFFANESHSTDATSFPVHPEPPVVSPVGGVEAVEGLRADLQRVLDRHAPTQ